MRYGASSTAWRGVSLSNANAGARVADVDDTAGMGDPFERGGRRRQAHRRRRGAPVRRQQRVARQGVQDVGEDQFLVLLLVLQPQFEQRRRRGPGVGAGIGDESTQGLIHVRAVGVHLGQPRPRQQAALRPRVARAERFVVGIEEMEEARIERPVARRMRPQHHRLEEPGGMGQVPFGRAGVGHGLDALVLGRQRRGERQAVRPHAGQSLGQFGASGFGRLMLQIGPASSGAGIAECKVERHGLRVALAFLPSAELARVVVHPDEIYRDIAGCVLAAMPVAICAHGRAARTGRPAAPGPGPASGSRPAVAGRSPEAAARRGTGCGRRRPAAGGLLP